MVQTHRNFQENLQACHYFQLQKRKDMPADRLAMMDKNPSFPDCENDIILEVKLFIANANFAQFPRMIVPSSKFQEGISLDNLMVVQKVPPTSELKKEYLKTASRVSLPPWHMVKAQQFLEALAKEELPQTPATQIPKLATWLLPEANEAAALVDDQDVQFARPSPATVMVKFTAAKSGPNAIESGPGPKPPPPKRSMVFREPAPPPPGPAVVQPPPGSSNDSNPRTPSIDAETLVLGGLSPPEIPSESEVLPVATKASGLKRPAAAPKAVSKSKAKSSGVPKAAAAPKPPAPVAKGAAKAKAKAVITPPGITLGCSRCRFSVSFGCKACRTRAGLTFDQDTQTWKWTEKGFWEFKHRETRTSMPLTVVKKGPHTDDCTPADSLFVDPRTEHFPLSFERNSFIFCEISTFWLNSGESCLQPPLNFWTCSTLLVSGDGSENMAIRAMAAPITFRDPEPGSDIDSIEADLLTEFQTIVIDSDSERSVDLPSEIGDCDDDQIHSLMGNHIVTLDDVMEVDDVEVEDFIEVFSQPRLVPTIARLGLGLRKGLSVDILTGYNLLLEEMRVQIKQYFATHLPRTAMLSPPCTMFAQLMNTNWKRMCPVEIRRRWAEALVLWNFALQLAWFQLQHMGLFVLEHPTGASSWRLPETVALLNQPGVFLVSFHQCRFGLKAPISGQPIRKSTRLLTNSKLIQHRFDRVFCKCTTPHKTIQGSEGPHKLSKYCEVYLPELCEELAKALAIEARAKQRQVWNDQLSCCKIKKMSPFFEKWWKWIIYPSRPGRDI